MLRSAGLLLLSVLAAPLAHADDQAFSGTALQAACPRAANQALTRNPTLDAAARAMAQGETLDDALAANRYRQQMSMAARIVGKPAAHNQARRTARVLFTRYCEAFGADGYSEVGVYRAPNSLHLIFARPRREITADDIPVMRAQLLALVNEARATTRQCGGREFSATGPVRYSDRLTQAAIEHAVDMARRNALDHAGSDGSSPGQRIARVGYRGPLTGENLAVGFDDPAAVLRSWLESPDHCENIMEPRFREMGVAFAVGSEAAAPLYWAQTFGAPPNTRSATPTVTRH